MPTTRNTRTPAPASPALLAALGRGPRNAQVAADRKARTQDWVANWDIASQTVAPKHYTTAGA